MALLSSAGGVLVVNAGSTSLKLSVVDADERSLPVAALEQAPRDVAAVAHRIVHGGELREPTLVDDAVMKRLRELVALAPLHNRPALAALEQARRLLPGVPQVAVFDTAFHATIPPQASTYALPRRWREEWGIRRYGFHGLAVAWAAWSVPVARLIVAHLGGGCSVTAVARGRSVDTTMGYSPLDGVPMVSRSGGLDPTIVVELLRSGRLGLEEIAAELEEQSGLLGLSGTTGLVGELERACGSDPAAALALAVFAHRVAGAIAAMAAALDGVDALVFSGGIGEHSARTRADVAGRLGFMGIALDPQLNAQAVPDAEIAPAGARVRVIAMRVREDVIAARAARALCGW